MASILGSVKKALGIAPDYTEFDVDLVMHINSVFSTLQQLGVGPVQGFMIDGETGQWEEYLAEQARFNMVRSYMVLKVRMLFDPPTLSYLVTAMEKQIDEYEWRLNVEREDTKWVNPNPTPIVL